MILAYLWSVVEGESTPWFGNFMQAPGCPGYMQHPEIPACIGSLSVFPFVQLMYELVRFALGKNVDLVVIGPEAPLLSVYLMS